MENKEIWKDIPGYEGLYQMSNNDSVKVVEHIDAGNRIAKERILTPHINKNSVSYGLTKDKKIRYYNVNYLRNITFPTCKVVDDDWRPVVGFEKYYEVSRDGAVKSKEYYENVNGKNIHRYPKILKQHDNSDGYYLVKLRDNKNHPVHRLVAEAFVPNDNNLPEVDHIDGNRKNNNYKNLRFVTHQENIRHTIELGNRLIGNCRGKNYNAKSVKLTDTTGVTHYFSCIMDACEFIKQTKNLTLKIVSMYGGIKNAYLNEKQYHGFTVEFINS